MTDRSVFTAPEVLQLINDLDYSRLDYWARQNVLVPSVMVSKGRGSRRLYAMEDIIALNIVTKLRKEGVGLDRIRRIAEQVKTHGTALLRLPVDTWFITDGMNIGEFTDSIESLLNTQTQCDMFWVFPIGLMVKGLQKAVSDLLHSEDSDQRVG